MTAEELTVARLVFFFWTGVVAGVLAGAVLTLVVQWGLRRWRSR